MRSRRSSRSEGARPPLMPLVKELLKLQLPDLYSALVSMLGDVASLAVTAVALANAWGLQGAASYVVAAIVMGPSAPIGLWDPAVNFELESESAIPRRVVRRIGVLTRALVALCANPPIVAALFLVAASLGFLQRSSLTLAGVMAVAVAPLFFFHSLTDFLNRFFTWLVIRLRLFGNVPPATPCDYAWLLIRAVWFGVVMRLVFVLTPLYYPLASLPLPVRVAAALLNPYALSMELARSLVLAGELPLELAAAATAAVALFWFSLHLYLGD